MKVAFDSRPAKETRGRGRYTSCLLAALRDADRGEVIEARTPRRCDLFHSPWIDGALLNPPVPMVVTLHDLTSLKRAGEYLRSGLRIKLHYLALERAARVIVPTRTVADDAMRELKMAADRIAIVAKAPAPLMTRRTDDEVADMRDRFGLPEDYLLWVGPLKHPVPRKRIAALARAKRTLPLVLVGRAGRWARELPNVTLTGQTSDDDLAALYTGARALLFPSEDEGFPLPPLEALACGTPVVASDCAAMREVLGDRIDLRPMDDFDGLIATAEAARRPAPSPPPWTWRDAAAATWDVYAEALSSPTRVRARRGLRRSA